MGARKTIRFGMIGAGGISDVHLMALAAHESVDLACIADPSQEACERQGARYGIRRTVSDYREMLDDPAIDAVDIAVPHYLHCPIALDALAAEKDVICEKPIGLDLDDADAMIRAAENSTSRLLIKKYLRSAPHHQQAKEIIDAGGIGRVYLATGLLVVQQLAIENDVRNWRGTWDRAGGGVMIDAGIHLVDLMQFLLGPVVAVSATAKRLVAEHPEKADDTASLTLEHGRGAISSIVCANCDTSLAGVNWEKAFYGTAGSLHIFQRGPLTKLVMTTCGASEEISAIDNWWEAANVAAVTHLVDCLREGSEPIASLADARHDLDVMRSAYRSSAEGRRIVIAE